ncbi:T9SS type A sorting domain-containing protein [Psychroflexus sp. CAK1W]|uniref:T9SS type A sorting domain-containing protein n=1 Tax=Psychroflexus curvus TaxID=2873595 RepID=UPI001CCAC79C|nr:T9SS type A sorting domain-containing protein [Psychroflexus curvus]MBZ9629024.1 T9SS type A sorting domain-containing protein [Psychroflexus curvus]
MLCLLVLSNYLSFSQTPINEITASYQTIPEDLDRYTAAGKDYSFGVGTSNNLKIKSFTFGTDEFAFKGLADEVVINREDNATTTGIRDILFFETSSTSTTDVQLKPGYKEKMEKMFNSNIINRGADNMFVNADVANTNNIERIDFLYYDGLTVPSTPANEGFMFMERGGNDSFKVAFITSLNASNQPATFTQVITVNPVHYGASSIGLLATVLNDGVDGPLVETANLDSQLIHGTLISFADFNLTTGDQVFGYVIMGNDVTATTDAEILDTKNEALYPRNTSSSDGGADLIAGGSLYTKAFIHDSGGWIDNPNNFTLTCDDYIYITGGTASITKNMTTGYLYFDNNASLDLNSNTLNICKNLIVKNGSSTALNSTLVFSGTELQNIEGEELTVDNIELNNSTGLSITGDINLKETLLLSSGNVDIDAASRFTFKSTATKTAVLSETANSVSGHVIVERYIPKSNRSFRYISPSVSTTSSIQANLQEGGQITDYNTTPVVDPNPGFGTHITGSTLAANGFDATITGNPSMFSWDEANQQWNSITNTNEKTLSIGESYALMVRGGRELDLTVNNTQIGSTTVLRFTGELLTGDYSSLNLAQGKDEFSLVANPYQAQVDMKALLSSANSTGINDTFMYAYDPTLGTYGGYVTIDLTTANGDPTPSSSADKFLQPNQSVFIQNTEATPGLTFKENYKKSTEQAITTAIFKANKNTRINISLKRLHHKNFILVDGVTLHLGDSFDNSILYNDALKFWNSDESLTINHNDNYLSVERRKYPGLEESIQLNLFNYKATDYQLTIDGQDLEKKAYLKDNYTGNLQIIKRNSVTTYSFSTDKQNPNSVLSTRFEIKFQPQTLGTHNFENEQIRLYPNPASKIVHIKIPDSSGEDATVQLVDMTGKILSTEQVRVKNGLISTRKIKHLERGLYLIKIEINQQEYIKKIMIN